MLAVAPRRGPGDGRADRDADRHRLPGRDAGVLRRHRRNGPGRRLADRGHRRHAGARGRAVNVVVTTPGGTAPLATGYTYVDLPALTSVAPDNGPIGGGTTVTLTGSGFRAGMPVRFGGALAALVSVDPGGTSATVITPAHAAGTVDVTVTTPGGTGTATNGFTYVGSPTARVGVARTRARPPAATP